MTLIGDLCWNSCWGSVGCADVFVVDRRMCVTVERREYLSLLLYRTSWSFQELDETFPVLTLMVRRGGVDYSCTNPR